jgi:hypothetical protein
MDRSIERLPHAVPATKNQGRSLSAVSRKLLAPIIPALTFGTQLREIGAGNLASMGFGHDANMVRHARAERNKWLSRFAAADQAYLVLFHELQGAVGRKLAIAMIGALLRALGGKADRDDDLLDGAVDLLAGDDVAAASGLWEPLRATPATLALGCRMLVATSKFVTKPAEIADACRKARSQLKCAMNAADGLRGYVRRCDALLLQFDREEWARPYRAMDPAVLRRMLVLHHLHGDGSSAWEDRDEHNAPPHPFEALVIAEQEKFAALPAPEPLRLAACGVKAVRRTRKLGGRDA